MHPIVESKREEVAALCQRLGVRRLDRHRGARRRQPRQVQARRGDRARYPRYFRPTEVETLLGDPSKAKAKLGWTPTTTLLELVKGMVEADYTAAKRDSMVKLAGFQAYGYHE